MRRFRERRAVACVAVGLLAAAACAADRSTEPERIRVRPGMAFVHVADSLAARGIIRFPTPFRWYARATGRATRIRPGTYEFSAGSGWRRVLDDLVAGRFLTEKLVIPEGWTLPDIAARVAAVSGVDADSLREALADSAAAARYGVPGPTLEGYLYPATYTVPVDGEADAIIDELVATYRRFWTGERRAQAAAIGLSEREVVTLASIIEKEAVRPDEMTTISAVYHNRLRIGMRLQADPTVQYALGDHRERLLYADIERVRDHPYNTYTRAGLPPGPIGAPGAQAMAAALAPADANYLYFVARADGSHIFSRTLAEHNRARAQIRRQRSAPGRASPS